VGSVLLRTPNRHPGERFSIGEVEAAHNHHSINSEFSPYIGWSELEVDVKDPALGPAALALELGLDGAEPSQGLADGCSGYEPAESLPGID